MSISTGYRWQGGPWKRRKERYCSLGAGELEDAAELENNASRVNHNCKRGYDIKKWLKRHTLVSIISIYHKKRDLRDDRI